MYGAPRVFDLSMGRTGRLGGIMHMLRFHSWMSAQGLVEHFSVSLFNIYYDVAELQSYGVTIRSTVGRDGGYQPNG
jgi:predicted DNA-binding transcriptional regulator YafY